MLDRQNLGLDRRSLPVLRRCLVPRPEVRVMKDLQFSLESLSWSTITARTPRIGVPAIIVPLERYAGGLYF